MLQIVATTETGEKVLLMDDGTWTVVEEKPSKLVYVEVITSKSTYTGMYGSVQDSVFNPSPADIAIMLQGHGVQPTLKERGSRMTLRIEATNWSIIDASGQLLYHEKKPAIQFKNRIKDAAQVIKRLM